MKSNCGKLQYLLFCETVSWPLVRLSRGFVAALPVFTSRLELRDFTSGDFAAVHEYASDPRVTQYLWWGPNSEKETQAFLSKACAALEEKPRRNFELAIVERATHCIIGGCSLACRRTLYAEYEIGYCLRRDAWGQGFAEEAIRALIAFGFQNVHAHRIYGLIDPENERSIRLLERIGFRREGHLRKDVFIRGEWRDSLIYALLNEK